MITLKIPGLGHSYDRAIQKLLEMPAFCIRMPLIGNLLFLSLQLLASIHPASQQMMIQVDEPMTPCVKSPVVDYLALSVPVMSGHA